MYIENAFYEDKTPGVYCSVTPTQHTLEYLSDHVPSARSAEYRPLAPCQWHVTVIYDAKAEIAPAKFSHYFPLLGSDVTYRATIKGFDWFAHPKLPEVGAAVVLLDSPELQDLREFLFKSFGFKSDYPDYKPHLTLAEKVSKQLLPVNTKLIGASLVFGGFRIENVK